MISIEKRKFLAELGRLLTFMYEEDRQTALSMYENIFDSTDDSEGLRRILVSPTKQAVIIARCYNAKERDLSVRSASGEGVADVDSSDTPRFVKAIQEIAASANALQSVKEDAGKWEAYEDEKPEQEDVLSVPEPVRNDIFTFEPVFPDFMQTTIAGQEENDGQTEESFAVNSDLESEIPDHSEDNKDIYVSEIPEDSEEHAVRINNYIASFSQKQNDEESGKKKNTGLDQENSSQVPERKTFRSPDDPERKKKVSSSKETNVFLLILYIILAVPFTAVGILILLVPAALFLALAVVLGVIGFQAISAAFGGFAVFADIMVVLGGALVVIALALLAFLIFLWFIGGAIVSHINGVIRLGEKICIRGGDR